MEVEALGMSMSRVFMQETVIRNVILSFFGVCVYECVCASVCGCVCVFVPVCVCVCVCCTCVLLVCVACLCLYIYEYLFLCLIYAQMCIYHRIYNFLSNVHIPLYTHKSSRVCNVFIRVCVIARVCTCVHV